MIYSFFFHGYFAMSVSFIGKNFAQRQTVDLIRKNQGEFTSYLDTFFQKKPAENTEKPQ